jgi:PTH1 family peptidyl-tRNA hydrolase
VPISQISNFYKIDPKDILVIHDDIDLPVWKIQLKLWWSSAGHNWLKDIIQKIWSAEFWRIRIWVDRPVHQKDVVDYVLSKFKKEEIEVIENKFEEIEKYVQEFLEK